MLHRILLACALLLAPLPSVAQSDDTLADIRQQLTVLFVDVQRLKRELSTTGGAATGVVGSTSLQRLNAIEQELQRLTSKTEELEFRINRITADANNRIGDLNFRLCELEADCDIGQLEETPLAGLAVPGVPPVNETPQPDGPALAVGERQDYERAQEALSAGDYAAALSQLDDFTMKYPGSPLTSQVQFLRGEALEGQGRVTDAARAYLEAFSGNPSGPDAADALYKLGMSLGRLGQTQDACLTLAEVNVRFPGHPTVAVAQSEMRALGCQ